MAIHAVPNRFNRKGWKVIYVVVVKHILRIFVCWQLSWHVNASEACNTVQVHT